MADILAAAAVSTASLSIVGPLLDWLRGSEVVTEAAKSIATGPLGNWSHQLAELARKSGWGLVIERLSAGRLPPNHDVARASRRALSSALLWMAHEIDGQVPVEVRAELLRSLERGTPTPDLSAWPPGGGCAPWVQGLMRLAKDDDKVQALEYQSLTDEDVRQLIRTQTDAQRAQAFHGRVRLWLARHLADLGPPPPDLNDFLGNGWSLPGLEGQLSLYQAWCVYFREQVKREPRVFNSFVATALADLLAGSTGPLALERQDFASGFSAHLDGQLQEVLRLTRETHDRVQRLTHAAQDTTAALQGMSAGLAQLPDTIVQAVVAALQAKWQDSGAGPSEDAMVLALARRLKIEDVQNPAQALAELERLVSLARAVIQRGLAGQSTGNLADSTLAQVAALTAAGQVDESRLAIERALGQITDEELRQAERRRAERVTLLDAAIQQEKVARDVDRTVAALLRRIAIDDQDPVRSTQFEQARADHLDSGLSELVVFDVQVALAISRCRLAAADTDATREPELRWVASCLAALGQISTGLTVLPFVAHTLEGVRQAFEEHREGGDFIAHLRATFEKAQAAQARLKDWTRHHAELAVAAFRELVQFPTQATVSVEQIWARRCLGNALHTLAEHQTGAALLEESSALYMDCLKDLREMPASDDADEQALRERLYKRLYGEMRATGQFLSERQQAPTCAPSNYWSDEW